MAKEDGRIEAAVKEIIGGIQAGNIVFDEIKAFEPKALFLSPKRNTYITGLNESIYKALCENLNRGRMDIIFREIGFLIAHYR